MTATAAHLGTATVVLELAGQRIVTDPVLDPAGSRYALRAGPLRYEYVNERGGTGLELVPAAPDLVLLSHDHHRDNLDDAGLDLVRRAGLVITTPSGARRLARRGVTRAVGLAPWARLDLPGLVVTATPARHGPLGTNWVAGDVTGFFVESPALGLGPLYITGDTRWFAGVAAIADRLPRPGTILAHVGAARFGRLLRRWLRFSLDAREARRVSDALAPRQLVPIHYDGWSHFTEGRVELERAFAGAPAPLRWLPRGQVAPLEP